MDLIYNISWIDWVKEFSELLSWKERDIYIWLPNVQPSNLYLSLLPRKTTSLLSSAHLLGVVVVSGSTFIGKGFLMGNYKGWGLSRWVRKLLLQVPFVKFQSLHFCLYLRSLNRTTLRSVCCKKAISKLRDCNWRFRKERVNQWRNGSYACKYNSTVCLIDIAVIIILVFYFICLVDITIFFASVTLLFSLLLLRRTLTLQLLLLLEVLFPLRRFISIWNARIVGSISGVSLPREFCLNSIMYNILSKVRDRHMRRKNKGRDRIS